MNEAEKPKRLYQQVAIKLRRLVDDQDFPVGSRLPAERELALMFGVSRPTIREAVIALELEGLVEVRTGSGVYVLRSDPSDPEKDAVADMDVGPFELTEARALFEPEAAALAATLITDEEIKSLEVAVDAMARENKDNVTGENADHDFHMIIARATRNSAIASVIDDLFVARERSFLSRNIYEYVRKTGQQPAIEDHRAILEALRSRDPQASRLAMRSHLMGVIENILLATEVEAVEEIKRKVKADRERFSRAHQIG